MSSMHTVYNVPESVIKGIAKLLSINEGDFMRRGPHAQMGVPIFQLALIRSFKDTFVTNENVNELLSTKGCSAHINAFIQSTCGSSVNGISAIRLMPVFYSAISLASLTTNDSIVNMSKVDNMITALINFDPIVEIINDNEVTGISVDAYNKGKRNHTNVLITFCTGSGLERTISICPQCCDSTINKCNSTNGNKRHYGDIVLTRTSRSAASKTKIIAYWSCCGQAIAQTSSDPIGYKCTPTYCTE